MQWHSTHMHQDPTTTTINTPTIITNAPINTDNINIINTMTNSPTRLVTSIYFTSTPVPYTRALQIECIYLTSPSTLDLAVDIT